MTDTRPKPTKQQQRLYLGLLDKITELNEKESGYYEKERPYLKDPTYPKPWEPIVNPDWEAEKRLIQKKISKIQEEIDRLLKEMYPPEHYPEMHGATEQPALIEGVDAVMHNAPPAQPKSVEDLSMTELEDIFGARKSPPPIVAKTTAGAEILKRFEEKRNRTRRY